MKKHFMLKLNPPRPTFAQDMSEEERSIMQQHVVYWRDLMNKDIALVYGPVIDPEGVYGLGIIAADSAEQVEELINNDPATGLNQYEYYPMMAVVPTK
ncbi:MAG: YciI family protein [Mucilaginibacter sp.]